MTYWLVGAVAGAGELINSVKVLPKEPQSSTLMLGVVPSSKSPFSSTSPLQISKVGAVVSSTTTSKVQGTSLVLPCASSAVNVMVVVPSGKSPDASVVLLKSLVTVMSPGQLSETCGLSMTTGVKSAVASTVITGVVAWLLLTKTKLSKNAAPPPPPNCTTRPRSCTEAAFEGATAVSVSRIVTSCGEDALTGADSTNTPVEAPEASKNSSLETAKVLPAKASKEKLTMSAL